MNLPSHAALARYGAVKVTTASPGHVLLMLYDGLLRFLREAQTLMTAGERGKAGERISKSNAILAQLAATLDFSHAPQLCAQLQAIYMFCMQHLLKANLQQNPAILGELVTLLLPLRDAWSVAVAEVNVSSK